MWPFLVGLMLVPLGIHILLFFAVESPKYLYLKKNDIEGAKSGLLKLRDNDIDLVNIELDQLRAEKESLSQIQTVKLNDFFTVNHLRRPLIVCLLIQVSQGFCGKFDLNF